MFGTSESLISSIYIHLLQSTRLEPQVENPEEGKGHISQNKSLETNIMHREGSSNISQLGEDGVADNMSICIPI